MSKKNNSASLGMIILLGVALAGYVFKDYISVGDDSELAEEAALGHSSEESSLDDPSDLPSDPSVADLTSELLSSTPLELPRGGKSHGIRIAHTGFVLDYDTIHHTPFWVAWQLTREESRGSYKRDDEQFLEDHLVPEAHAVRPSTYSGTGYSRGHMCPAGDQKWSADAMHDSFYMTNMCPQTFELNKTWWDMLERAERQWARQEGSVYIVCGPIYDAGRKEKSLPKKFYVGIPHRFFKVILSTRKGHEKALGFIYLNDASEQYMEQTLCTVDEVERITGYDFFAPLEDTLEDRLESHSDLSEWGELEPYQFRD